MTNKSIEPSTHKMKIQQIDCPEHGKPLTRLRRTRPKGKPYWVFTDWWMCDDCQAPLKIDIKITVAERASIV